MKKSLLAICIAITSLASIQQASGQLWVMGDAGCFIAKDAFGFGPTAKAGWHFGDYDINMATLGGGYYIIPDQKLFITVYDTLGGTDTLESTLKSNIISIDADYRRYLLGTDVDDFFAFYAIGGVSAWMLATTVRMPEYDKGLFAVSSETKLTEKTFSIRLPVGVGVDATILGKFWWYFEARLELPITQVNNEFIGNDFGVSYGFCTGVRVPVWRYGF